MLRTLPLLCLLALSACETVKGVGRDITRAAESVDWF
jgi:predicted small secreted protein